MKNLILRCSLLIGLFFLLHAPASAQLIYDTAGASWKLSDLSAAQAYAMNYSTVAQTPAATTRTYIAGTAIAVPRGGLKIGSVLRWRLNLTKTAAGSASSVIDVAIGTAGTTADTAVISFTKPAGTAAADEGWIEVTVLIRGPITASCIGAGEMTMGHNLASTGHATIPYVAVNTISSGFDATTSNLIIGLCITTGASDAVTIQMATANASNL